MISGDYAVNKEAAEWIPGIEQVTVKKASSRWSAEVLPPAVTQLMICEAAERVVRSFKAGKAPDPVKLQTPVTIGLEFLYSEMADKASLMPGSRRVDGRKIEFEQPDMPAAYQAFRAAVTLAQRT
nr:putative peptidase M55 D-aminopeptidase [uncultured bacterium]